MKNCNCSIGYKLQKQIHYICKKVNDIMSIHCECGICGHGAEQECITQECQCCTNFHIRSGQN